MVIYFIKYAISLLCTLKSLLKLSEVVKYYEFKKLNTMESNGFLENLK